MSRNVIGKFRDAEFIVTSDDLNFGRRKIVHEYPLRDNPYVEDNGKKAREFSVNVLVIGNDFEANRDKLMEALEQPGSGTLVHPEFGTMTVSIISARLNQNNKAQGKATFSITFIQGKTEPTYPTSGDDTPALVNAQADKTIEDSINDFAKNFDVLGQSQIYVDDLLDELDDNLVAIDNVVGSVTAPLAGLIRSPYNFGAALAGSLSRVQTLLDEPGNALNLYKGLIDKDEPEITTTNTPQSKQHAKSNQAMTSLIKRLAICEAAKTTAKITFETSNDAISIQQDLTGAIDEQIERVDVVDASPIDDTVYFSLVELRAVVIADLRIRAAQLPKIKQFIPLTTLPALVIAHNVYGDAKRESELVTRNKISHPGFVQGGQPLEVLADV